MRFPQYKAIGERIALFEEVVCHKKDADPVV